MKGFFAFAGGARVIPRNPEKTSPESWETSPESWETSTKSWETSLDTARSPPGAPKSSSESPRDSPGLLDGSLQSFNPRTQQGHFNTPLRSLRKLRARWRITLLFFHTTGCSLRNGGSFPRGFQGLSLPSWDVNVDAHSSEIEGHSLQRRCLPSEGKALRRDWNCYRTLELQQVKFQ